MKEKTSISLKLFAFVMSFLILVVSLPSYAFATLIQESSIKAEENSSEKTELIVLEEEKSLRDENIKHFKLSDGSTKAVIYSQAVHYLDENGDWIDIDNALTLNGSEYSSNNKTEIKFANKSGSNGLVSIKDGEYKIDFTPLNTNKVSVEIENPQQEGSRKFEDVSALNNLISKAIYSGVYEGVDLEYILIGNKIKENIVVNEKSDSYTYSFEIKLNKLKAELKNNSIILCDYDTGARVYEIPAPYMQDSNGAYSQDVSYSLAQNSKWKYTLTVTANPDWINNEERVLPVRIDPPFNYVGDGVIDQAYGNDISDNTLKIGTDNKSFVKLTSLPTLPQNAYLTNATISLKHISGDNVYIGAYSLLEDWVSTGLSTEFDQVPLDYCHIIVDENGVYGENGWFTWSILDAVKAWYEGTANNGIGFSLLSGSSTVTFASEKYSTEAKPVVVIEYRDMKGVESYWSYLTQSASMAGTGYVNLATGNLTFEIGTLATTDSIFGYTPTLIYNSSMASQAYMNPNAQTAYWYSYMANGFKLSMNETIVKKAYTNQQGEADYYYLWADADGTEHSFVANENGIYYDEDGLQLRLSIDTENNVCIITDSGHNQRYFSNLSGAPASVGAGAWYLTKLIDKNGNELRFFFDGSKKPNDIKFNPSGTSQTTTMISPLYNSNGKLTLLWCENQKEGIVFLHSVNPQDKEMSSSGTYLRQALYIKCDSSITWSDVISYLVQSNQTTEGINVLAQMDYGYDSQGRLMSAQDNKTGYIIDYHYTNGKVTRIYETGINSEYGMTGQQLDITYYTGYTEVRSLGNDFVYHNDDDIITTYYFDEFGRAYSIVTTNLDKTEVYSVSSGEYETENPRAMNNLKNSFVTGVPKTNYLSNGDFESSLSQSNWVLADNATLATQTNAPLWDDNFIKITVGANEVGSIQQLVTLDKGKYNLSFDLTAYDSENLTITVKVSDLYSNAIPVSDFNASGTDNFGSVSFELDEGGQVSIVIEVAGKEGLKSTREVTIDNVMLSNGYGTEQYNYIFNGAFDNYDEEKWVDYDGETSITKTSNGILGNALAINGNILDNKAIMQSVYKISDGDLSNYKKECVGSNGIKHLTDNETIFTLSGFGKLENACKSGGSFNITAEICYYVGGEYSKLESVKAVAEFSQSNGGWQFSSTAVIIPEKSMVTDIRVFCNFLPNIGTAYFDNISLTCEETRNTSLTQSGFYSNGRLKYVVSGANVTVYGYDSYGNVADIITRTDRTINTYDEKNRLVSQSYYTHNVYPQYSGEYNAIVSAVSANQTLRTIYEYTYNEYGLNTETRVTGNSEKGTSVICSTYQYQTTITSKIFGALLSATDSFGQTTRYFYDEKKGYIKAIIKPNAHGEVYEYDDFGALISVQPAEYTNSKVNAVSTSSNVQYNYDERNLLSEIIVNDNSSTEENEGTIYSFTYGLFSNPTSFAIAGSGYVINKIYDENDYNKLLRVEYADKTVVNYTYDEKGNVTKITVQENDVSFDYSYEYNASGAISKFIDGKNNATTLYKYDSMGRLAKVIEYDNETMINSSSSKYTYDEESRIKMESFYQDYLKKDGTVYSLNRNLYYSYDELGNLSDISMQIGKDSSAFHIDIEYDFDSLNRNVYKDIKLGNYSNRINYVFLNQNGMTSSVVQRFSSDIYNHTENAFWSINEYVYVYDENYRNIIEVKKVTDSLTDEMITLYKYEYDDFDRLTSEENCTTGEVHKYTYDTNGNILSEKVYTKNENGSLVLNNTYTYAYGNSAWKDQLTSYQGQSITYDSLGNPLQYINGMSFTWENINNLATVTKGEETYSYTYNANGIRTSKTVNGVTHNYVIDGTKILTESYGNVFIIYIYDETDSPVGMAYMNYTFPGEEFNYYFFTKNLQGDIMNIYHQDGFLVASYEYDAWGNHKVYNANGQETTSESFIGNINPFRYRGYYYDNETGLYYLNARYYDPETKRFVNADDISYLGANGDIQDFNLYAYCNNNPVMYVDPSGKLAVSLTVIGLIIGAVVGAAAGGIGAYNIAKNNGAEDWELFGWTMAGIVGGGVVGGALGAGVGAIVTKITGIIGLSVTKYSIIPIKGVTLLGHMPGYIGAAQITGSGYYLVADNVYNNMVQKGVEWTNNMTYLKDANALGSKFAIVPDFVVRQGGTFWKEIQYLISNGIPWEMFTN
ncbi:MAG: RHS repeat-associated core domain-containing protein [Clostridia bacterium]|nr:RHS repeat-associated core domain-containing protein [Clostridia bacterium]